MRKILAAFIFLVVSLSAFCEVPELQKILPTEWKLMTKLSENEKATFDNTNKDVYTKIYKTMKNDDATLHDELYLDKETEIFFQEKASIYKETIGSDFFYWVVLPVTTVENPIAKPVVLSLFREENGMLKLLTLDVTNIRLTMQTGYIYRINTVQIIEGNEQAKGFIQYVNATKIDEKFKYIDIEKGQLKGSVYGFYFLFKDEPEDIQLYAENIFNMIPKNWNSIRISASDFLWDKDNPLKYGLQNAFDGDPATSYVENTDDDLMEIGIDFPYKTFDYTMFCKAITFINGYAKNENLYTENNRIKNIDLIYKTWEEDSSRKNFNLRDNCLIYQPFTVNSEVGNYSYKIHVKNIFKGTMYNDTCIAELNMRFNTLGWLFGDINE